MKKILVCLISLLISLPTIAQDHSHTIVGFGLGAISLNPKSVDHTEFTNSIHIMAGLDIDKHITPVFGLEIESHMGINSHDGGVEHVMIGGNLLFNLNNIKEDHYHLDGTEIIPFIGFDWHHSCREFSNNIRMKIGPRVNFNIGEEKRWQIQMIPTFNYILADDEYNNMIQYNPNINRSHINVLIGLSYEFKNTCCLHSIYIKADSGFGNVTGYHHFDLHRNYISSHMGLKFKF